MKIRCAHCPARYTVPEEKVRGRKVKIKCKKCGEPIYVDGTKLGAAGPAAAAATSVPPVSLRPSDAEVSFDPSVSPPAERERSRPVHGTTRRSGESPSAASPSGSRAATKASTEALGSRRKPVSEARASLREAAPPPAEPVDEGEQRWTVALDDQAQIEWTLAEVVDAFAQGAIHEATYIWQEGMSEWTTPLQVAAIASALQSLGIVPRDSDRTPGSTPYAQDDDPATVVAPTSSPHGFMWRDQPYGVQSRGDAPSFDDITVALPSERVSALAREALQEDDEVTHVASLPLEGDDPIMRALTASLADEAEEPAALMQRPAAGRPPELSLPRRERPREAPRRLAPSRPPPAREEDSVVFSLDALIKAGQSSVPPAPPKPNPRNDASLLMSPGLNAFLPAPPPPPQNTFPQAPFTASPAATARPPLPPQPFTPTIPPTASLSDSNPFLEMRRRRSRNLAFWLILAVLLAALAIVYLSRPDLLGL